jgi:malate dehydrogenase (oxaloacetate-decarboxylating)(NADP+)
MRVHERPSAEELADIAMESAAYARRLGHAPRVALLSYSNFGQPSSATTERIRDAVAILDRRGVDFEYDGDMAADTALNPELMARLYPFCRLTGPANVLVMPALHSASIAAKLMQEIGGGTVIGPILLGLEKPVQIVQMGATADDLVMAAALAAHDAIA